MKKILLAKIFLLSSVFLFPSTTKAIWNFALNSTSPANPAGNVCPGAIRDTLYKFTITLSGTGTANTLDTLTFTTNAGYAAASLTQFELWRSALNSGAPAAVVGAPIVAGGPGMQTFNPAFSIGNSAGTWTFWILMTVAASPTIGDQVSVSALTTADFTFSGGTKTGSAFAGGTRTIIGITSQPTNIPICLGNSASLTIGASLGPAWTYQWQYNSGTWNNVVNSVPAGAVYAGNTSATLIINGLSVGSYQYRCIMGGPCGITSNTITVTVIALTTAPPLTIVAFDVLGNLIGGNPLAICQFQSIDFFINAPFINALPNTYTWKVNGIPVLTQNNVANYPSVTYSSSTLANGDSITLEVSWPTPTTSPVMCLSPSLRVSNTLNFTITPNQPPSLLLTDNSLSDTICFGDTITFTATPIEAGTPTYQWYLNGAPVGTASTYTTLSTLPAGNHQVLCCITSSEFCDTQDPVYNPTVCDTVTFYVEICSSIEESNVDAAPITVFPNPAANQVEIRNPKLEIRSVEIYNVLGEKVFSQPVTSNPKQVTISVADFSAGIYFVKVKGEKNEGVAKFVKQ